MLGKKQAEITLLALGVMLLCKQKYCDASRVVQWQRTHPPILGSIPRSERSPGEENGNLLQYSCLGNPMDREEPGGLQSIGLQRVRHDLVAKQQR